MDNPVASTLHHKTVAKIRRLVSEQRAAGVNTLELKMFYDMYASAREKRSIEAQCQGDVFAKPTDTELESAMDFTVVQQEADPLDDVIADPPTQQYKKDGWLYNYGTYIDLFRAGLLTPIEDSALDEVLILAQKFGEDLSFNGKVNPPSEETLYHKILFPPIKDSPVSDIAAGIEKHPPKENVVKTTRKTNMATETISQPAAHRQAIIPPKDAPPFGDKSWDDYVLSLLRPNEIAEVANGGNAKMRCPRNIGLRRVLQELVGPIMSVSSDMQCVPDRNNRYLTVARTKVTVEVQRQDHPAFGQMVTWEDFGNNYSSEDSVSDIVVAHPATSAQTSAESRCFKKILGLGSVHSAEEMIKTSPRKEWNPDADTPGRTTSLDGPIEAMQIQFIENTCSKYHARPLDIASQLLGRKVESLNGLSFSEGLKLQAEVNQFNHHPPTGQTSEIDWM